MAEEHGVDGRWEDLDEVVKLWFFLSFLRKHALSEFELVGEVD